MAFLCSLHSIGRLLKRKQMDVKRLRTNTCLLNLNLITFASECAIFGFLFALSFFVKDSQLEQGSPTSYTSNECKINIYYDCLWLLIGVIFLIRLVMTSQMNIKFSRSLE